MCGKKWRYILSLEEKCTIIISFQTTFYPLALTVFLCPYACQRSLDIVPAEYDDILFDSDDQLDSEEPGYDITTTQEHRVRFDKNGKLEKVKQAKQVILLIHTLNFPGAFSLGKNSINNRMTNYLPPNSF